MTKRHLISVKAIGGRFAIMIGTRHTLIGQGKALPTGRLLLLANERNLNGGKAYFDSHEEFVLCPLHQFDLYNVKLKLLNCDFFVFEWHRFI